MAKEEMVNIAAAKTRLPELVERASSGEKIVLARNGKPKAMLVPVSKRRKYVFGAGKGQWRGIERILDTPLSKQALDGFSAAPIFPTTKRTK
jgi:prevent-host-death family protein